MTFDALCSLAEENHVQVDYFPMCKVESCSFPEGAIVLNSSIYCETDDRLLLAHELGHCITGSFYNQYARLDVRAKHEYRANKWSYEHLLPYSELCAVVKSGEIEIWQIAERLDLPCDFVAKAIAYYGERLDDVS